MANMTKTNFIKILSFFIDAAIIAVTYFLSKRIVICFRPKSELDFKFLIAYELLIIFFFYMFDLYSSKENSREDTFVSVVLSSLGATIVIFLLDALLRWHCYTLIFWFVMSALTALCLECWRLILSINLVKLHERKSILIVESKSITSRLARKIKYSCNSNNTAWYCLIDEENNEEIHRLLNNTIKQYDSIYISPAISRDLTDKIYYRSVLLKKDVIILATMQKVATMNGVIVQFGDTPVIQEKPIGLSKFQRMFKRLFDIIFSSLLLIITSPIFLICAVAIKLDSKGSVIYRQERYTRYKKVFTLYKFRTMVSDAEKCGAKLASKSDPRITRVGNILRKLRLDELPQLMNILKGDMSVVGPRPERPCFADEYCEKVANYDMRHSVKAGLTGYAQIYGKYNTRASDKILMDMIYVIKYSLWLDLKLILLTVKTMFISSSTEGVDEAYDEILNTPEREEERRLMSFCDFEKEDEKNEAVGSHSGI